MGLVELVAAHADGACVDHAAQRDEAHFRRAAADVDDEGACSLVHGKARTDGGGHRFFNQVDLGGAGGQSAFLDRAALDLRGAAGNADDDARRGSEETGRAGHADELLEHLLGHREVGDHAVLHRTDGVDVAGHTAEHLLGGVADGVNRGLSVGTALLADGNNAGFIQDDALAAHVDERVGGAEVNGKVIGEVIAEESKHFLLPGVG